MQRKRKLWTAMIVMFVGSIGLSFRALRDTCLIYNYSQLFQLPMRRSLDAGFNILCLPILEISRNAIT